MGKKTKRCLKKCQNHRFLLKPVHYSAFFSRELEASYCPPCLDGTCITPRFNKDKRHFTSSFVLPIDHIRLQNNSEFYREEHEKYKVENIGEKSEMMIPKPKSKYSYCSVCKADYEDYLKHIQSENHRNRIKENKFDGFIEQMCHELKETTSTCEMESQESIIFEQLEHKPSFASQQTGIFDMNCSQKSNANASQGYQYKQINEWLHTCKTSFQLLPDAADDKLLLPLLQEDPEAIPTHPPISPFKRYSEPSETMRQVCNLKPIILFGRANAECDL